MYNLDKYSEVKSKLQTGDIVFFRGKKLLAKTIQLVDNAYYNHCGIVIKVYDRLFIIDSLFGGVQMLTLNNRAIKDYKGNIKYIRPNCNVEKGLDLLFNQVDENKGYDIGMLFNYFLKMKLGINNKLGKKNKYICSELVQLYLEHCGLFLNNDVLTPQKIYDILL